MRIALVNVVYKKGSTGQIVENLKNEYLKDGHDVYVLYGRGAKINEPKVYKTGFEFESNVHHAISKVSENLYGGMFFSTLKLKRLLKRINPDVVHLHCLNGFFVNIYSIIKFLKTRNVKVILTNHADFMFTANCGFSLDCKKWKTDQCKNCPYVKEFNGKHSLTKRTHYFYKKMLNAFKGATNFVITGVSPALTKMIDEAPIFSGLPAVSINNGFKLDDFAFVDQEDPYKKIRTDENTKIVLHVTSGFHLKDKGGYHLYDIAQRYLKKNVKFVVIGNMRNEKSTENIIFLGRVNSKDSLVAHYHYADATILLSEYETFSMVVAESLLSGTEVIGFLSGGPESVAPLEYAAFVEFGNIEHFVEELDKKLNVKADKKQVQEKAKATYDIKHSKNKYESLFENKNNKKTNSFIHKARNAFSSFLNKKYSSIVIASVLFGFFLLYSLSSIFPSLFSAHLSGAIYRAVILLISVFVILSLAILQKSRPRLLLTIILFVYALSAIIISVVTPAQIGSIDVGLMDRLNNLIRTFGIILFVFAFIDVLPSVTRRKETIKYFSLLVAAFAISAAFYSIFFQFKAIVNSFIAEGEDAHFYQIASFFTSKNAYGIILMFGIIGATYSMFGSSKLRRNLLIAVDLFLFLNLIISRDKTAILLVSLIFAFGFIYVYITSFKAHFKRNMIIGVAILIILTSFTLFMTIPSLHPTGTALDTIHHYFYQNFFLNGIRTMGTRFDEFGETLPLFKNPQIIFGYGDGFVYSFYSQFTNVTSIDNAYLAVILSGGIIKTILLLYIFGLYFSKLVLLFRQNKKIAVFALLVQIMFILQGLTESIYYLISSASAILIYVFTYLLVTSEISSCIVAKEKRILHVVGAFKKGGTEAFILGYMKLLRSKGITTDVYSFGEIDKTQEEKIKLHGGAVYKGTAPSKKNYLKAYFDFKKFLRKHNNYLVVHGDANFDSALYLRLAKDYLIEHRISHAHDTLTGIKFSKIEKLIMVIKRLSLKISATDLVACSYEAGQDIFGQTTFDEYGKVIRNLVDSERFLNVDTQDAEALKKIFKIPNDAFLIGNISRFEEKKNQAFIVDVFSKIAKVKENAILVLGGPDGGIEEEIKIKVKELGLDNKVRFIGLRSDVPLWLKIFDLYLFPSKFEGFGIVVLENQIAGLPTIASDRVPRLADLNLGLVDFLPLNDINRWVKRSLTMQKPVISQKDIIFALKNNGFELEENLKHLLELYNF